MSKTAPEKSPARSSRTLEPAVSIKQFMAAIERLPEKKLRPGRRKVWYTSQKEHWLGWLQQYDGPGAYGRTQAGHDATFAYNHIVNPQMLLWLIEVAGVSLKFPCARPEFPCSINHLRWIAGLGF